VIAKIPGAQSPDEWVIRGNHRDAWVFGAWDPLSGHVAMLSEAKAIGALLKTGWRPKRTVVIASWDGEEWGLLGSTEWAEKHQAELARKAVAYVNSDSTGKGWLSMSGSHSLQTFVNEVARDVADPRGSGTSVLEARRNRLIDQAKTEAERATIRGRAEIPIDALGSGSDYTVFLDYLQIASLDLGFGGDGGGGVYHSAYDSFYWYTHFSDGTFAHTAALSRTIGTALLRLADADVVPFEFRATASTLRDYLNQVEKLPAGRRKLDFSPLRDAIRKLSSAADAYEKALEGLVSLKANTADPAGAARLHAQLAELNRVLYSTERAFRHDPGLPRREWFKHLAYAPGFYTGYGVKTLPGIREGLEQEHWDEAASFIPIVSSAVLKLAGDVRRAEGMVKKIGR
jgi:N-acetylated-alpha-linked acidic dipeptidase